MRPPADLALIEGGAPFFARAVNKSEPRQWRLRDCRLTLLPLRCKTGGKALRCGLNTAWYAGCRVAALPYARRCECGNAPLQLADGNLFALSALPRLLDLDCPGWRRDMLSINAGDNFSCLAARMLAPYCARIHIFGAEQMRRQALSSLLYRESGLIVSHGRGPLPSSLIILPPGSKPSPNVPDSYLWQRWPLTASTAEATIIDSYLAEALLLLAGGMPESATPLALLRLLNHRGSYHEILPVPV